MNSRVFIMLGLAVVFGGAAVVSGNIWLDRQAALNTTVIEAPQQELQTFGTIVVASEALRFGVPLERALMRELPWPAEELPDGAFSSIADVMKDGRRVVLRPLTANEPILAAKITGGDDAAGLSRVINDGHRAVTIRVDDVAGVAGFIFPGDRVDVVLTRDNGDAQTADDEKLADVILQNVRVLSIDQVADESLEEPTVVDAVTVEADPRGAQRLALASSVGSLSLILRQAGDALEASAETITVADLISNDGDGASAIVWVNRRDERDMVRVPGRARGRAISPAPTNPNNTAPLISGAQNNPDAVASVARPRAATTE